MNADDLRAVATDIREKANAAVPGPWTIDDDNNHMALTSVLMPYADYAKAANAKGWRFTVTTPSDGTARHVAAWHPAVALIVADWLDEEAAYLDADRWTAIGGVPLRRGASDAAIAFVKIWPRES